MSQTTRVPLVTAPSKALDSILAELQSVPAKAPGPSETAPSTECCSGDRRGYQWHQRTGNLPACQASADDAAAYMRRYYDRSGRYEGRVQRHRQARKENS